MKAKEFYLIIDGKLLKEPIWLSETYLEDLKKSKR